MSGPSVYDYRYVLHDVGGHSVAFEAANQDLTDPTYQYFGFVSSFGSWIVQRFKISVSGTTVKYEYYAGTDRTVYDALWNTSGVFVGTLTFTTFDQIIL